MVLDEWDGSSVAAISDSTRHGSAVFSLVEVAHMLSFACWHCLVFLFSEPSIDQRLYSPTRSISVVSLNIRGKKISKVASERLVIL